MESKKKVKGIRSTYVFIPTMIVIGILYVSIIVATVFINKHTVDSQTEMSNSALCLRYVSNMQGTSSKLSEIATSFTHMPVVGNPSVPKSIQLNESPIREYAKELEDNTKTPEYVIEEIKKLGASDIVLEYVSKAAPDINRMKKIQARSLYLINSYLKEKYNMNIDEYLKNIEYTYTDEDNSLSAEDKKDLAYSILLALDYSSAKANVSEALRDVNKTISVDSSIKQEGYNQNLRFSRAFLWVSIALILVSNIIFFAILLRRLVFPVTSFAKNIEENKKLESKHGLYEAKYLAIAYNSLLDRHQELEDELREVAEFDSLTGLPNRYCYNEFLKKPQEEKKSVCVFLFDINNLKYVNDTYGHAKGDELIKNASLCIKECFLNEEGKNCYRIGGDEFVAILENIEDKDISSYIEKFEEKQKELNVSIAVGYKYTDNILNTGFEKIVIAADKMMYKNKNEKYKLDNKNSGLLES